jgi:hypothetical protein
VYKKYLKEGKSGAKKEKQAKKSNDDGSADSYYKNKFGRSYKSLERDPLYKQLEDANYEKGKKIVVKLIKDSAKRGYEAVIGKSSLSPAAKKAALAIANKYAFAGAEPDIWFEKTDGKYDDPFIAKNLKGLSEKEQKAINALLNKGDELNGKAFERIENVVKFRYGDDAFDEIGAVFVDHP